MNLTVQDLEELTKEDFKNLQDLYDQFIRLMCEALKEKQQRIYTDILEMIITYFPTLVIVYRDIKSLKALAEDIDKKIPTFVVPDDNVRADLDRLNEYVVSIEKKIKPIPGLIDDIIADRAEQVGIYAKKNYYYQAIKIIEYAQQFGPITLMFFQEKFQGLGKVHISFK